MSALNIRCTKCGSETPEELAYCLQCRSSLIPRNVYDLTLNDFAYEPDRSAMDTVRATGSLPYIAMKLLASRFERSAVSNLHSQAHRITYPSQMDTAIRTCATSLSVSVLPEVLIADTGQPNAFTFGDATSSHIVLDSGLLEILTRSEMDALLGHELGHVKSGHLVYHTVAEALSGGLNVTASMLGIGIISVPLRLALLSWHRESEVTADRASLLAVDEPATVMSLLSKLASSEVEIRAKSDRSITGTSNSFSEILSTHPLYSTRFSLIEDFLRSKRFELARLKIASRKHLLRALIPYCRFCGASKRAADLFCPRCGKSQI